MMKAAEDLKQQQLLKEQERNKILAERIIPLPDVDGINDIGMTLHWPSGTNNFLLKMHSTFYEM